MGVVHSEAPKIAFANLLYAVVVLSVGGLKVSESESNIGCHPVPSFISHSYSISPPSAAKSETGFDVP